MVGDDLRLGVLFEGRRGDDVGRQLDREAERVLVAQLLGHLAPDEHHIGLPAEVAQDAELVLDLGAAGDEHEWALDLAEELAELLELTLEQQACVRRQQLGDADRRRVRAVHRPEGVFDEQLVIVGQSPGEQHLS